MFNKICLIKKIALCKKKIAWKRMTSKNYITRLKNGTQTITIITTLWLWERGEGYIGLGHYIRLRVSIQMRLISNIHLTCLISK